MLDKFHICAVRQLHSGLRPHGDFAVHVRADRHQDGHTSHVQDGLLIRCGLPVLDVLIGEIEQRHSRGAKGCALAVEKHERDRVERGCALVVNEPFALVRAGLDLAIHLPRARNEHAHLLSLFGAELAVLFLVGFQQSQLQQAHDALHAPAAPPENGSGSVAREIRPCADGALVCERSHAIGSWIIHKHAGQPVADHLAHQLAGEAVQVVALQITVLHPLGNAHGNVVPQRERLREWLTRQHLDRAPVGWIQRRCGQSRVVALGTLIGPCWQVGFARSTHRRRAAHQRAHHGPMAGHSSNCCGFGTDV